MVNYINEYFTEIVDNLTRNMPPLDNIHYLNLVPFSNNTFFLVTQIEIHTLIMRLKEKSFHLNDIPAKILKYEYFLISYFLEIIFNKCIEDGIYLNLL